MKRFNSVSIIFPVRGHSYMDCDNNIALINQKFSCEMPNDCVSVVEKARSNPEPFHIIDCPLFMFENFSKLFKNYFIAKCPFASRPVRQLIVRNTAPVQILIRSEYYTTRYESYLCIKR